MEIQQLRCFLAVLEHGSISTAAHALGLNQPAVSKTVRRLETELGVQLFERVPRGVVATKYARTLAHFATAMDSNLRSAVRQLDAMRDASAASLSIGAGATWRERHLPRAIARLLTHRPAAHVRVVADTPEKMLALLLRGELDFILSPLQVAERHAEHVVTERLLTGDLVVAARVGHPLGEQARVGLETLARARWALPGGAYIRERFDRLFLHKGIEPPAAALEVEDTACLFDVVAHSDLLTFLSSLRLHSRAGRLVRLRGATTAISRDTGIIARRDAPLPQLAAELIDALRALVDEEL